MTEKKHVVILKNDAVGDLTQSLHAINNIIKTNKYEKIIIYLSERSEKFYFLINNNNIEFRKFNYNLTFLEKIKFFLYLIKNKITKVYILTPKSFYFLLPPIFKKIKFYAICINGPNNYKRPNNYFRKYLYKYVINDRAAIFKRDSTVALQSKLTNTDNKNLNNFTFVTDLQISKLLKKYLPENYLYFHIKKNTFDKLGWGINELKYLFNELLKFYDNIIFTKDIEIDSKSEIFYNEFSILDFSSGKFIQKNKKIFLFDRIEGVDLYNTIRKSTKILAFHGMMTNLGSLEKKPIIDLWYCDIKNWDDYRNYRNAFYEFKPKYPSYKFIIPNNDIKETLRKMMFALQND